MDYSVLWAEVERELDPGSHDMDHVRRVYKMASRIARPIRGVNLNILLPAAILHDIARKREDAARPGPPPSTMPKKEHGWRVQSWRPGDFGT